MGKFSVYIHIATAVVISGFLVFVILYSRNKETLNDCKSPSANTEHGGPPCPPDWIVYNRKCFYYSLEEKPWSAAQKFCSLYNASLAVIEEEEKDFVKRYKGSTPHWIGLHREPKQPWKWINGNISMWQVLGDGGNCAFLNDEGKASCSRCYTVHHWICSKPDEFTISKTVLKAVASNPLNN